MPNSPKLLQWFALLFFLLLALLSGAMLTAQQGEETGKDQLTVPLPDLRSIFGGQN